MFNQQQDDRMLAYSAVLSRQRGSAHPPEFTASSSDSVYLGQMWTAMRRKWLFITATGVVVGCLVLLYTLVSGMRFRAVGQLYLGEVDRKANVAQDTQKGFDISGGSQQQVASEIEILRSRSLVKRTALETGLNVTIAWAGQRSLTYWQWRKSKRNLDLIDGALGHLQATNTTLDASIREPQRYRVRFVNAADYVLFAQEVTLGQGKLGQQLRAGGLTLTLVGGSKGQPKAGSAFDLIVNPLALVVDDALRTLRVSAPKESAVGDSVNVVTLEFTSFSPNVATNFLDKLMLAYLNERQGWKTEDARAAEAFVSSQLLSVRASLDQLQSKLANYRSGNGVVVLDNQAKAMVEQIGKYEEQRANARLQVAAFTDMKRALKAPNPPMGAFLLGEANDTVLEHMADSLSKDREKLTDLETRFHDVAPEVREQRARVAAQLDAVRNYVSSREMRAQSNLGTLHAIIGQFEEKLKTVPGAELGLAQLTRESEVYSNTYSYLLERQQQAGIIKASTLSKNRILDAPDLPLWEDSPMLPLRFTSVLVGLLLGAGIVIVRSLSSGTIQSQADVRKIIGTVPILASIPRRPWRNKLAPVDLVAQYPNSPYTEVFRAMRVKLSSGEDAEPGKVFVLTSPSPESGTTTCVRSLASAICADGKSVLVVDANLRQNGNSDCNSEEQVLGLSEFLTGKCDWPDVVSRPSQSPPLLRFISSGAPDQPELLTKAHMRRLLIEAREFFDYILIDCPSFPQASEALALSKMSDGTLSVLRLLKTFTKLASDHIAQIATVANFHAVIVSDDESESGLGGVTPADTKPRQEQSVQPVPFDLRHEARISPSLVPSAKSNSEAQYECLRPVRGVSSHV